jgi:hypothetical protein
MHGRQPERSSWPYFTAIILLATLLVLIFFRELIHVTPLRDMRYPPQQKNNVFWRYALQVGSLLFPKSEDKAY